MKFLHDVYESRPQGVTSYAEVWIEIRESQSGGQESGVTSYAEVWIEIMVITGREAAVCMSPPTRRCGLKSHFEIGGA